MTVVTVVIEVTIVTEVTVVTIVTEVAVMIKKSDEPFYDFFDQKKCDKETVTTKILSTNVFRFVLSAVRKTHIFFK